MNDKEMNCLAARRIISTDISDISGEFKQHIMECASCKAFYEKQLKFNTVLKKAVEVDVPDGLAARIIVEHQLNQKKENTKRRYSWSAMAASLMLVFAVGIVTTLQAPPAIAGAILEYVHKEAEVLHDKKHVTLESINQLLKPHGIKADKDIGYATHASTCMIKDKLSVHIVFVGENAPVTLIVFPEPLKSSKNIEISDDVFKGVLINTKKGTIALVSECEKSLNKFKSQLKTSLMTYI